MCPTPLSEQLPFQVAALETPPECNGGGHAARQTRCQQYALATIFMLGSTQHLLGSAWSSFSEAAREVLSMQKPSAGTFETACGIDKRGPDDEMQKSLAHEVHAFNGEMGPQGADDVPFEANLATRDTAEQQRDTSIIMVCRDKKETQLKAVEGACNASAGEVVVVDWSSKPSDAVDAWTHCPNGGQLQVIRVENETTWELGRAYNLALTFATRRNVLKIDCDSALTPDFISAHPDPATSKRFYAGNWKVARDENEIHLNGIVYASREHWLRVGGYDERITSYGWDDDDLYARLEKHARRRDINFDKVSHMPHQPQSPPAVSLDRFSGFAHPALDVSSPASTVVTLQLSTQLNRLYLEEVGPWNSERLSSLYGCGNHGWSKFTVCRALFKPWPLRTYKLSAGGTMKAVLSALHVLSEIPDKCRKCDEPLALRRQWKRACAKRFDAAWGAAESQSVSINARSPWQDGFFFLNFLRALRSDVLRSFRTPCLARGFASMFARPGREPRAPPAGRVLCSLRRATPQ